MEEYARTVQRSMLTCKDFWQCDRGTADLKVPLKEIFYLCPSGFIPSVTLPAPSLESSAEWKVLLPVFL